MLTNQEIEGRSYWRKLRIKTKNISSRISPAYNSAQSPSLTIGAANVFYHIFVDTTFQRFVSVFDGLYGYRCTPVYVRPTQVVELKWWLMSEVCSTWFSRLVKYVAKWFIRRSNLDTKNRGALLAGGRLRGLQWICAADTFLVWKKKKHNRSMRTVMTSDLVNFRGVERSEVKAGGVLGRRVIAVWPVDAWVGAVRVARCRCCQSVPLGGAARTAAVTWRRRRWRHQLHAVRGGRVVRRWRRGLNRRTFHANA